MLSKLKFIRDSHLGWIDTVQQKFKLPAEQLPPIQLVTYRAGLRTYEFEKDEVVKMPELEVSKQSETSWRSLIVPTPKKNSLFRSCLYYKKL